MRGVSFLLCCGALFCYSPAAADLPQQAGWPIKISPDKLGTHPFGPRYGAALVDLVGDSGLEVVGSADDRIWVWDRSGKAAPGWPLTVSGITQPLPSFGDVDGDGDLEIIQVGRGAKFSDTSHVHVIHHDGTPASGWPLSIPRLVFHSIALADLDGNGRQDLIILHGGSSSSGTVEVRSGDGKLLGAGWKHDLGDFPVAPAAVGDVDGDGVLEVVTLTQGKLTVRGATGALRSPFPVVAAAGREHAGGVTLADLDGAKGLEIISCDRAAGGAAGPVRLLVHGADGKPLVGFPVTLTSSASSVVAPTVGDVDGDGQLEIVAAVSGAGMFVVSADGKTVSQAIKSAAQIMAPINLVDLDGDGKLELLCDNNSADPKTGNGYLEAYEAGGAAVTAFPLMPPGHTMANASMAADADGDGTLELTMATSVLGAAPPASWVSLWSLPASKAAKASWPTYAHDLRRSSCAGCAAASSTPWVADAGPDLSPDSGPDAGADLAAADAAPDAALPVDGDDSGCSCRLAPVSPPALPALIFLALLVCRGRRGRS